ncbi:hypothetical protein SPBR_04611 [Sporothrix brasiliensis 5110]|uniref:Zn(2)-C6 fungal-type domain-containing protein n=1 Tax=Sporothrix brasiliensis 5110 TaxID=1398154 RepID=A0A0C2IRM4_9PEZI|nr:uncharacterized protein SPBR_04611 [Sporothrix brasiliensis 5110]KIH87627.1 hypothetical protein SPBR_04611 [Sporothrix brasiliensis 5110]
MRPPSEQMTLPDSSSFPPPATKIPERHRPPPLQQVPQQPLPGFKVHHADSPQEVSIACEKMFDEKPLVSSGRDFLTGSGDVKPHDDKPVKRRMRGITSCLECRRRKMKCGRTQPCDHCHKSGRVCIYLGDRLDPDSQGKITEIKEKVSSLELQLQKSVVHQRIGGGLLGSDVPAYSLDPAETGLEISHMVTSDLIYDHGDENSMDEDDDEDEATNDMIDLGFKVGRMRMTERIGGLNRPRLAEEINVALASKPGTFGFNLNRVGSQRHTSSVSQPKASTQDGFNGDYGDEGNNMSDSPPIPDFLRPSNDYIPPSSGALFGHLTAVPAVQNLLPSSWICDFLKNTYFTNVHPIASCLHQPTFEQQFSEFLLLVGRGRQPRRPRQALVLAVLFSGVVAADEQAIAVQFNVRKIDLVGIVKYGVEASLGMANLLRTTSVEAMQAFVIYLVALCRDEVSRSHSIMVGAAIRMAECMALHRDGSAFGLTPLETHVRRLIWHQLCFLDIRTCEAQGPRPTIHREDYDTFLPYNCDDDDLTLEADMVPFTSKQSWASSFLAVLRFEVNEMMRIIWIDRFKLERRKSNLTIVMAKIDKFCHRLNQKYEGYLDDATPIKRYTKLVKELFICRMHVMVLHPYHSNTSNPLSERLHSSLIQSGIRIIEIGIELETNPEYAQWRWYLGAFMQYQIALLLTTEAFHGQSVSESDRISRCLDYVFDTDPSQGLHEKAQGILYEVMQKSATYCEFRKLRAPTSTKQAVPQAQLAQHTTKVANGGMSMPGIPPHRMATEPNRNMPDIGMVKNEIFSPGITNLLQFSTSGTSSMITGTIPSMPFQLPTQQYQSLGNGNPYHQHNNHHNQLQPQPQPQQRPQSQLQLQHKQHQKQQQRYQTATNDQESIPRTLAPPDTVGRIATEQTSELNLPGQPMAPTAPYAPSSNNMVFSGVANGEALWGHPQVVNADSPEAFGGEWSATNAMQQQQTQPLQQQPSSSQQQQPQHINLGRHQYPYTTTAGLGRFQEQEGNLLDSISWVGNSAKAASLKL